MRSHQRSISKVTLLNVLKRRKSNLKRFLADTGIVTYELLKSRCDSMGVIPPEESEFLEAAGSSSSGTATVSSPAEGLIVLDPPKIINEITGKEVVMPDVDSISGSEKLEIESAEQMVDVAGAPSTDDSSSKKKKKK